MVLKLTRQKATYKNLKKKEVFDIDLRIFLRENSLTKIRLQKIKERMQDYFYATLS
tara:strand:- start:368 stop:535 length:168 start_codon:yes stop_codon:yes gene_type:complete